MNDLTISNIERQNVLNNTFALQSIQENLDVNGLQFHDQPLFTTKMVADFYGVDERTIKRYVREHEDELRANGYFLSQGNSLKELKLHFVSDINVPKFTRHLGIFPFRAFLNIGMLLTESEKAKQLRTRILDIVIATINGRAGGGTKYINWRDRDYLPTAIKSENYRKNFTRAVGEFVDGLPTYKYEQITDLIYKAVFRENAKEYREVLRLQNEENVRHTLYAEVLLCISSFENGVAAEIVKQYNQNGQNKLSIDEIKLIIDNLATAKGNMHDSKAAFMLLALLYVLHPGIATMMGDFGYRGSLHDIAKHYLGINVEAVVSGLLAKGLCRRRSDGWWKEHLPCLTGIEGYAGITKTRTLLLKQ